MNFLDWTLLFYLVIHILVIQEYSSEFYIKLSTTVSLILLIFRCFLSLQIFQAFSAIIGIIIRIIFKLGPFFLIVLFFYTSTSIMYYSLDTSMENNLVLKNIYIWTIFAGIDDATFDVSLSVIPVIFGTAIISVVLMNILIAYLSNEYSRLEERQIIAGLKTKAELNLDIELVISFFKRIFSSKFRKSIQFHDRQYVHMMETWDSQEANLEFNVPLFQNNSLGYCNFFPQFYLVCQNKG